MAQFLLITTLLTLAGLIATSVMGFIATPGHHAQHIFVAIATAVLGIFSQAMTLFFFIGTGKEIKEAANQDAAVVQQTKTFKAKVFPVTLYALLVLMATFIMGGGVAGGKTPRWLHLTMSIASVILFARAYWVQLQAMTENASLMERYLKE